MANTHSIDLEAGSSQYLSIADGDQTGLDLTTDFTFEMWIKLESLPSAGSDHGLIGKDNNSTERQYVWRLENGDDTADLLYFSDDSTFTNEETDVAIVVAGDVGKWVHLAVSVDISAKTIVFYKNGESVASTTNVSGSTTIQNAAADFTIGEVSEGGNFFDGLMDDIRVWSDIRTQQEIQDNMSKELAGNEANLVGYWKLNNSLLDKTSNNNDLTNNNSAVFVADPAFKSGNAAGFF